MKSYKFTEIDHHIGLVRKEGEKLQDKIHALGISILSHWANNVGDGPVCAEKMTALQQASPYHSNSFSQWVALKTGMLWSEEKECWYVQKGQKLKKDTLDAAKEEPFWKVSPPKKATPLTDEAIVKMLQGILDKREKHTKKPVEGDAFTTAGNKHIREAIKEILAGE